MRPQSYATDYPLGSKTQPRKLKVAPTQFMKTSGVRSVAYLISEKSLFTENFIVGDASFQAQQPREGDEELAATLRAFLSERDILRWSAQAPPTPGPGARRRSTSRPCRPCTPGDGACSFSARHTLSDHAPPAHAGSSGGP